MFRSKKPCVSKLEREKLERSILSLEYDCDFSEKSLSQLDSEYNHIIKKLNQYNYEISREADKALKYVERYLNEM